MNATTPGAPLRRTLRCRRARGTEVAKPPPVPSSGFLPLSTVQAYRPWLARGLLDLAVRPEPPTLRGLLSYRSRPWSFPPELSLPEEPYPLSRAYLLPCEFVIDHRQRSLREIFTTAFTTRVGSLPVQAHPKVDPWTHEPGRRFPAIARPVASTHSRAPHVPSHFSRTLGSPVSGRHARFEALLPPGVRSATTLAP
jgi:hypothetical protein